LKLEELGLSPEQLERIQNTIQSKSGIVLVSAPHAHGRTSALYALVRAHDAFLSHIITVEREPDTDLEGINQERLPRHATNAEETQRVTWICSQLPDVLMMDEVRDANTAAELIRFAAQGRRVYVGMRAASTFDALAQWRKLVGDDRQAVKPLELVINSRVLRKLCAACKIGYAPDPQTLRKLNMDPMRVSKLYQARTEPLRDAKGNVVPCEFCHDLRFRGRTGIYEVLPIDDDMRLAITSGASVNQLKVAFRQHRGKYLQEQALMLVEQGDTSIQEVLRVLKAGAEGQPPAAAGGGAGGGGVPPRRAPAAPPA
jgi:type II secretory ATPase GspE/PulE/Tfp pilus assembly ATPase PilB-like protein